MAEKLVTARDLARHTGSILHDVADGQAVLVIRHGRPVAVMRPWDRALVDLGRRPDDDRTDRTDRTDRSAPPQPPDPEAEAALAPLSPLHRHVIRTVSAGSQPERLPDLLHVPVPDVAIALAELELSGLLRKGMFEYTFTPRGQAVADLLGTRDEDGLDSHPMAETMSGCLFCRIGAGEVPSDVVHESDHILAFRDIDPQAPVHILLIPKDHIASAAEITDRNGPLLAEIVQAAAHLARAEGIDRTGWRLVTNVGRHAGQSVDHLHFHLLGGRGMAWPPG